MPQNFSSLCVPWDEKGWELLPYIAALVPASIGKKTTAFFSVRWKKCMEISSTQIQALDVVPINSGFYRLQN